MIELRFVERIATHGPREGSVERVLQTRQGACYPWCDVPLLTLERQALERKHAVEDADIRDYGSQ